MSLIRSLKALADEKRLKILQMLLSSDLCVGALAKHLGISKPAVSQHLSILRKAGLVKGEKRGYWTHYMVDRQALVLVAAELNELSVGDRQYETICWRINEMPVKKPQPEEVNMCQNCQNTSFLDFAGWLLGNNMTSQFLNHSKALILTCVLMSALVDMRAQT